MDLDTAVKGMLRSREFLRSAKGLSDAMYISEQMQRLAQYTAAVEEHLASYEEQFETEEASKFKDYMSEGKSANQAEILAKKDSAELKGQIAKLKRYTASSWQIVGVAQSRFNHLQKEVIGQT